ncbi:TRAP transporter large permease [Ponticoccus alexandrii]|uniref:TRAP transporter large permease protein n=1 Tax=Ponticoccus alexandrii TaxID=1943633 RepID=A0ABX7FIC5_9RHOB|nr:TRAP transporter large permease subunit [Ponticoccus alexandrii]ETA49451.1 C4-dicarboxylate ABC transporter permease [Rhodobacteraceae bacterium PD-2]QRF69354.1 TRAP transporter large permease subunit [Ponticoccus alexandrii]
MDLLTSGLVLAGLLTAFLASGVWIFVTLLALALVAQFALLGFPVDRVGFFLKSIIWRTANSWELSAVPLFLLMGELLSRTDITQRLFRGLTPLSRRIPGRLLHVNVFGSAIFAAVSGSSTATTAAVGRVTLDALKERGYSQTLSLGSLAGAGSLGLLIPPSIMMIVYGILAEVSIAKLFLAGVLPGLLVAALYSGYLALRATRDPALAPEQASDGAYSVLAALLDLLPVCSLIALVLGGIYLGIMTPTEAAAIGSAGAVLLMLVTGQFSLAVTFEAAIAAIKTSAMICMIVIAAASLSSTLGFLHLPRDIALFIQSLGLPPMVLILCLGMLFIVLGLFLDGISIAVMTLPITLPLVVQAGFDPLWFGIFLILMIELGLITPPVGLNLFVLQGLTGQPTGRVAHAAFPFFLLLLAAAVIVTLFPGVVVWLPSAIG